MSTVIKVENLSKQYRLGTIGTGTLSHDLNRWWHRVRGKEDPFLKVGVMNDRTKKDNSEYVWALKDINFEINKGDVVGIIGRNGAGKSTLLKILSRTTLPTTGSVKAKGRIASLLEVGTGFHPELTGRENIFLNGAILGMRKAEIRSKFDEIVDFAGVDKYVDTPVKRYSSGMYVRLAFAVAAHLDPEILIVDEVLAVGDSEFQKRALGKMKDVSEEQGRTVLFVSHNMAAIQSLCGKGIILKNGGLDLYSTIDETVRRYLANTGHNSSVLNERRDRIGHGRFRFTDIHFENSGNEIIDSVLTGSFLKVILAYQNLIEEFRPDLLTINIEFNNELGQQIAFFVSDEMKKEVIMNGKKKIELSIDNLLLRGGDYSVKLFSSYGSTAPSDFCDVIETATELKVLSSDFYKPGKIIRSVRSSVMNANYKIYS